MARDPADRYAAARDLADDLERFADHRPVRARRPGPVRRARKWAWRNRRPVAGVAVTLLAAVVGRLAVSAAVSRRAFAAEHRAREEAEANRRLALGAIADLGHASDEFLAHAEGMQDRQLRFLLKCRDTVEPFAADESLPVATRREIAWVHYRLAGHYYRIGPSRCATPNSSTCNGKWPGCWAPPCASDRASPFFSGPPRECSGPRPVWEP